MLVSLSWTASYAQTLELNNDTVHCYDRNDMKAIALRVIEATECDTITDILEAEIGVRDSVISAQDKIISAKDSEIGLHKTMLEDADQLAKNYEEELNLEIKKHKRTKVKWYVSLAAAIIVMTLITK